MSPTQAGKVNLPGLFARASKVVTTRTFTFPKTPEDDCPASATGGAASGVAQMTAYAERCPISNLVLSGYSQGANVAGDILGGGG